MFFVYLRRELRRRIRQAIFISLGLALGIGLVITVVAASDGVQNSQATADADDAVVDSGYAAQNKLSAGGTIDVGGTGFRITGIVVAPQGGNPPGPADVSDVVASLSLAVSLLP